MFSYELLHTDTPLLADQQKLTSTSLSGDTHGGMVIVIGNGLANWVLTLDKAVCILHSANTLRKGMNPTIVSPAMGK